MDAEAVAPCRENLAGECGQQTVCAENMVMCDLEKNFVKCGKKEAVHVTDLVMVPSHDKVCVGTTMLTKGMT